MVRLFSLFSSFVLMNLPHFTYTITPPMLVDVPKQTDHPNSRSCEASASFGLPRSSPRFAEFEKRGPCHCVQATRKVQATFRCFLYFACRCFLYFACRCFLYFACRCFLYFACRCFLYFACCCFLYFACCCFLYFACCCALQFTSDSLVFFALSCSNISNIFTRLFWRVLDHVEFVHAPTAGTSWPCWR